MTNVHPPRSDDLLERHQFYAAVAAEVSTLNDKDVRHHESVHRVHQRLDEAHKAEEAVREQMVTTETRNRTLAAAVVVAITAISGTFGWIFDKSATKVEQFTSKVEQISKDYTEQKRDIEALREMKDALTSTKKKLDILESDLKTLQAQRQPQERVKVPTK